MRIVYVTASLPYGPGESFVIPEILELQRRGHEILIVPALPRGPVLHGDARPLLAHVATRGLISPDIARAAVAWAWRSPRGVARVARLLRASGGVRLLAKNLLALPKALWLAGLARDWRADFIHAHWLAIPSTMALVAGEVAGIRWGFTAHRWDIAEGNLIAGKLERASLARFIDRKGVQIAREQGARIDDGKTLVLHMGVERDPSAGCGECAGANEAPPVVLCPASLLPIKGHRYLLEALGLLRERGVAVQAWLAGKGPLEGELRAQAESLGLTDRVAFLGQLSHTDLLDLYREGRVTLVVLPSIVLGRHGYEGIPVSLIEAMSFGVPVVATDTGGIPELLEGEAGLLVPHADPRAMADAIARLADSPDLRAQLAARGRRRIAEEFAIETIGERLERLIRRCVEGRSPCLAEDEHSALT